ncbi:hypothetical protein HanXRQr2_Chr15g0692631 [Helianthus annuus]|uniref:Uncharacterized protein n=1 Tax=Helianthus annuus TaxID=4232 RepID=A0A9K3DZW0_HELAN|nr:hypothetical protein HanXRQr2_Chr15g0692631 [Helianthus annuus]KAJ0831223.1 hypothetical protein HanPSC8_Chr15g0664571 [Helianthus annuus]
MASRTNPLGNQSSKKPITIQLQVKSEQEIVYSSKKKEGDQFCFRKGEKKVENNVFVMKLMNRNHVPYVTEIFWSLQLNATTHVIFVPRKQSLNLKAMARCVIPAILTIPAL